MKRNLLIIFVLIVVIAAALFLFYSRTNALLTEKRPVLQTINWPDYIPVIKEAIKSAFPNNTIEGTRLVEVYKEGDLTGDGIPEALIYTGSGGAYTDELVLVMIENGKPVLPKFKTQDGQVSVLTFLSGSSVRHGEIVDMVSEDNIIYSVSWSMDETGKLETCDPEVYLWNKNTELFEYDQILSDGSKSTLCVPLQN
jgi:hypothetical protein